METPQNFLDEWRRQLARGEWDFGHGAFRQTDPEFVRKAHEAQQILDQAELEKPFGTLAYANAEALKFSTEAVPAAQNAVAGTIASAYNHIYRKGLDRLGYNLSQEEYFAAYPEQIQRVMNAKVTGNAFVSQVVANNRTVGDYYPQLASAKTVGDLQSWLVSTMEGGLQYSARQLSGKGQDYADILGAMRQGVLESVRTYQKQTNGETNQFITHAGWGAYKASKNYMRWAKNTSMGALSLDAIGADTHTSFQLPSDVGNYVPDYEPGFENALIEAQNQRHLHWGAYGEPQSRFSSMQLGEVAGTWAEQLGLRQDDVVPAWNAIARDEPEVFGKILSAVQEGKTVPLAFARNMPETGLYHQGIAYLNSSQKPTFKDNGRPWIEGELDTFRRSGGFNANQNFSYPTGLYRIPDHRQGTTFNYENGIWVAPMAEAQTDKFSEPVYIAETDVSNLGKMYDMGLSNTQEYKSLQKAVTQAKGYITGALPHLSPELSGSSAAEDYYNNLVVNRDSEFAEASGARGVREDPANAMSNLWEQDIELAEYYGNTPEVEGSRPFPVPREMTSEEQMAASAAVGAETINRPMTTHGRRRNDVVLERAIRHNQFLRNDQAMAKRRAARARNQSAAEISPAAREKMEDAAYNQATEIGYEGDISARFMEKTEGGRKRISANAVLSNSERKLGTAVFKANTAAERQSKSQNRAPSRPTRPGIIVAHGYNGPIYGGGMGSGGIGGDLGGFDPDMPGRNLDVDSNLHLSSHNITGGGPSDIGNIPPDDAWDNNSIPNETPPPPGANGNGNGGGPPLRTLPSNGRGPNRRRGNRQDDDERLAPAEYARSRPTEMQEGWRLEYEDKREKRTRYAVCVDNPAQPDDPDAPRNEPGWYAIDSTSKGDYEAMPGDRIPDPGYGIIADSEGELVHSLSYGNFQLYIAGEQTKDFAETPYASRPAPSMATNSSAHGSSGARRSRPIAWGMQSIDQRLIDTIGGNKHLSNAQKFDMLLRSSPDLMDALRDKNPSFSIGESVSTAWNSAGVNTNMRSREEVLAHINEQFPYLDEASASALADTILDEKSTHLGWSSMSRDDQGRAVTGPARAPGYSRESMRTRASQGIGLNQVWGYDSPLRGRVIDGPNGELQLVKGGRTWLNQADLQQSVGMGARAVDEALSSPLPNNPNDAIATFEGRISDSLNRQKKAAIQELEKSGLSPEMAKTVAEFKEDIAKAAISSVKKDINDEIAGDGIDRGEKVSKREASGLGYSATPVRDGEQAKAIAEARGSIRSKIAEMGTTPEALAGSNERTILTSDEGEVFAFGGEGYGGPGPRSGGLWKGKVGQALYGAYLMKRLWSMSAGPGIQKGNQYIQGIGNEYERAAEFGGGMGDNIASRQAITEERSGRAAAQVYGGFSDAGYLLSEHPGLSRMGQYLGLGAGIAGTGYMGANMLAATGMISEGLGAAAGPAAIAAGAGVLAVGGGMELYNQIFQGGRSVMTFGNAVTDVSASFATSDARKRFNDQLRAQGLTPTQARKQSRDASAEDLWGAMTSGEKAVVSSSTRNWTNSQGDRAAELAGRNALLSSSAYETPEQSSEASAWLDQIFGDKYTDEMSIAFGQQAVDLGLSTKELTSGSMQYALSSGAKRGTDLFQKLFEKFAYQDDVGAQDTLSFTATRQAQLGSQIQAMLPKDEQWEQYGTNLVGKFNLSPTQVGTTASYLRGAQQFYGEPTMAQADQLGKYSKRSNGYVGGVISSAAQQMGLVGADYMGAVGALSGAGMSNLQASHLDQYMSGNMGFSSFMSYQNGDQRFRFQNLSGQDLFQTNGAELLKTLDWWSGNIFESGMNPASAGYMANQFDGFPTGGSAREQSSWLFGVEGEGTAADQKFLNAWEQGGTEDVQKMMRDEQREARRKQAGIQAAQTGLTMDFYWGQNSGGTWNNPAEGSSWFIQDQQRALQHQSTMANFAEQSKRLKLTNQFGEKREANSLERMNTSNAYSLWQMDFNYAQGLQQRDWTREDWQYQDTTRELNFGWSMDDVNENIRYASGRDRRKLITQRDRMAVSHNLDEQQVDKGRERQEEQWAREDERFEKQKDYTLDLQRLDKESFELNVEQRETFFRMDRQSQARRMTEYEEQKELEDELQERTRKYQYEQLQMQLAAAGAAAEAAENHATLQRAAG